MASELRVSDSLGLLETSSIAAGVRVADDVVKAAHVELLRTGPISPGKFLVVFGGAVADVEASLAAGKRGARSALVDELFLARVHPEVPPAIGRDRPVGDLGPAIGIVETLTVASTIVGADAAAKAAKLRVVEIATGRGIGGKGFFTLGGEVADVEAGVEAARALIDPRGYHLWTEILAGPHEDLTRRVGRLLMRDEEGEA